MSDAPGWCAGGGAAQSQELPGRAQGGMRFGVTDEVRLQLLLLEHIAAYDVALRGSRSGAALTPDAKRSGRT